jgi:hypothetical protein
MTELFRTPHMIVTLELGGSVVRFARTEVPLESSFDLRSVGEELGMALPMQKRRHLGLLADLRRAPPRNDPEFELAFREHVRPLFVGFARTAVLVRTAVGKLQVLRTTREDGNGVTTFDDEEAALAFFDDLSAEGPAPASEKEREEQRRAGRRRL